MIDIKKWDNLTIEEKNFLFRKANLLDSNGELIQPITQNIIKMLVNTYLNKSNIIIK